MSVKKQTSKRKDTGQSLEENCDNSSSDEIRTGIEDLREIQDVDDVDNTRIYDENSMGDEQIIDAEENGNDDVTINEWDKSSEAIQYVVNEIYKVCDTHGMHTKLPDERSYFDLYCFLIEELLK
nr:hypothetical protein [Tanacetum cinerariifolium]